MDFVTKAISCSTPTTLPARPSGNCCIRAMATPIGDGDGMHLTDDVVVAFSFYNVGIPNAELLGKNWQKPNYIEKQNLINDINAIFEHDVGIQAFFITEFGNMSPTIDELEAGYTKDFFEKVLREIGLEEFVIMAMPPYSVSSFRFCCCRG